MIYSVKKIKYGTYIVNDAVVIIITDENGDNTNTSDENDTYDADNVDEFDGKFSVEAKYDGDCITEQEADDLITEFLTCVIK